METIWKDNETDEDVGSPLTGELVIKILSIVFNTNRRTLDSDNIELEYEGADYYKIKPRRHKDFNNLCFKVKEIDDGYDVRIVPDYQIQVISECKLLGIKVTDGPEGFKDLENYSDLEDDLASFTDDSIWRYFIVKADVK